MDLRPRGRRGDLTRMIRRTTLVALSLAAAAWVGACTRASSPTSGAPSSALKGSVVLPVSADGLDADFFSAASPGARKAIVLLGGSEGGRSWSHRPDFIQALIERGFCVLSLSYFGTAKLPTNLRAIPLEYFDRAFHWLSSQPDRVVPGRYALVGVSRGAELALVLASRRDDVKAVVAIAPSSVVFPGPPTGIIDALRGQHSAWSEKGRELPFVPIPYSLTSLTGMISGRRTAMFESALQDEEHARAAAIPVERIDAPILLVSFTRDQVWPSRSMSEHIARRLREKRFRPYFEHAVYDGRHSEWTIDACRRNILAFLADRFPSAR